MDCQRTGGSATSETYYQQRCRILPLMLLAADDNVEKPKSYMVAAVPGSFSHRLFPKSSIHIALSTHALHWRLKIPGAILPRTMVDTSSQIIQAWPHYVHDETWNQLILEGLVSKELRDDFNFPIYYCTLEEVHKLLEKFSSVSEVQKEELIPLDYQSLLGDCSDVRNFTITQVKFMRGCCEGIYESHFGKEAMSLFFERFEEAYYDRFSRWKRGDMRSDESWRSVALVLCLRRKR
ncbi:hypothetical protein R1flu_028133 [Riccia fluitans]|uniref:Uncharacterized protein n=1 Tax=Riccia fluitans TaxID=41844 RepID=A0ABD1XKT3_9MARC